MNFRKFRNQITFIYIVLVSSLFLSNCSGQKVECNGGDIGTLKPGCTVVQDEPLIINGNVDEKVITEKLSLIKRITAGLEITGTNSVLFDLNVVEEITNPNGPAIIFKENKEIERFHTPVLKKLEGKHSAIRFINDDFIKAVYENKDDNLVENFNRLRKAANEGSDQCDDSFYEIHDGREIQFMDRIGMTVALFIVNLVVILAWIYFLFCFPEEKKIEIGFKFSKKTDKKPKKKEKKSQSPKPSATRSWESKTSTEASKLSTMSKSPISNTPTKESEK